MMRSFFDSVAVILVASAFVIFTTTGEEIDNSFTENGLSLLSYHLCNYSVVRHVNKLVAYLKSYEKQVPCGGWIPGRLCPKTYYKEDYHKIMITETVNLTDCCDGYEQVGLYCSLPLNRSSEFASRPGMCPTTEVETLSNVPCTLDMDCPEHKKCCETSKQTVCTDPVPEDQTEKKYWYKVSVLVKMDFSELNRVDPRLLNHSRLLHSMITGALWPLKASVYHIQTTQGDRHTETLASQILVGLQQLVPLANFSFLLNDIVKRVSEVIDIVVQDSDPGSVDVLLQTRNSASMANSTVIPQRTGRTDSECYPPAIKNHRIVNVTSSHFEMSWSVTCLLNHSFQIDVYKGEELVQRMETTDTKQEVFGLEAGAVYTVKISCDVCSRNVSYRVKTDALIFGVTVRILNYNFTDQLLNSSSMEYQAFSSALIKEIEKSFSSNMSELYEMGKLKMQIESLKAGSVVVRLKILIEDPEFPRDLSVFDPMISNLHKSVVLHFDPQSSIVEDWDECAAKEENDCCGFAECINTIGSYICRCKTTMDANPVRPGRNCEGEIVDPVTGLAPTAESVTTVRTVTSFLSNANELSDISTILPSSGSIESSTPLADKVLPTSLHSLSIWKSVENNNTLNTSETSTLVTEQWGNATHFPERNITEEVLTMHEQHGSSLPMLPGISNATVYASLRNGSLEESSTQGYLFDGSFQRNVTSVVTVTEHPELHAQNHSLDMELQTVNSSWSDTKPSSQMQSPSSTMDCGMPPPVERIVFTNVTGTSFHVVWTTNSTLKPTFQLLLWEGKQLVQTIKTQNSNETVSKLEPGILYTAEIRTEVCGNQSKPVQWKVKTAAQKLSGTVRITNLDYTSGFCNSTSEEYQNFTHLFLTEVRTSLPLNVRKEMDDGVIKMLITSVTNGSVIVSFDLLIAEGMDAGNVSKSFLDAFQHSSHFKVDNRTLSIHDYDECEKNETDCSPDASCNNTYGFYECKCPEGFASVNPERLGRDCEELLPNHEARSIKTKDGNNTFLPLADPVASTQIPSPVRENSSASIIRIPADTTTSTRVTQISSKPILNDHSAQQKASPKPALQLSIKNAVQVLCEIGKIVITIQKVFLQQESIPEPSLYLGKPHCNVSTSNSSHIVLKTGWNECGTKVQSNTTHTIIQTVLRNDRSSRGIIHHLKIISPIHCVFQNDVLTSSGYTPEGVYTIFDDLHGSGHFSTVMELFIGNSPIPKNFTISASDEIMIEVGIKKEDSRLKVVVSDCWATPTNNSRDPVSFPFIRGSCPVPHTHTSIIANGDFNKAQFKLKIFSFVNDSVVYLHCKIHICVEILPNTCRMTCKGVRSMRSGQTVLLPKTTWGPLRRSNVDLNEEEKTPGLGTGYIVLIVVCVIVLILGIAGLLYHHRQRKAGAYDFQVKSDNFNYQVFYD